MSKKQKIVLLVLGVLSLLVIALYLLPDSQGAQNPEMLSIFQSDEYAQFPYVIHMLAGGATFKQVLHNFLAYGHYYYGYPFYFFSALCLLPLKWILGTGWSNSTVLIMTVLRECINVVPMLLAVLLLVWSRTRFRSLWKSVLLFAFLESLAAVVANNTWWHPDSLLVFFTVLTLFLLQADNLRFGRYFYLSAFTCALAVGAKVLALLFVTTYAVYLLYGLITRKISIKKFLISAGSFLLLFAAAVVISNPQLLMPIERGEIIAVFKNNLSESARGFWVQGGGLTQNWQTFSGYIQQYYSGWIILLVALVFLVYDLIKKLTRLAAVLTLTWILTFWGYFLFIAATLRPHYFLPALLPLFAYLSFPGGENQTVPENGIRARAVRPEFWLTVIGAGLMIIFGILNLTKMAKSLTSLDHEVQNSASVQFFAQVDQEYLAKLPADKNFTFYRDWRAYVAPQSNWNLVMNWDLTDYSKIGQLKPAVIFLETDNILYFSDQSKQAIALDPQGMAMKYRFYNDAKNNAIQGYVLLAESSFGKAFARQDLYATYLSK